jgi:hypothetical protein
MENVGIYYGHLVDVFNGHLVYFMIIWCILWLVGKFSDTLVYFSRFGMLYMATLLLSRKTFFVHFFDKNELQNGWNVKEVRSYTYIE